MESTKVIKELGTGSGGTRNISGTSTYHADLENCLAELHNKNQAYYSLPLIQQISPLYGLFAKN